MVDNVIRIREGSDVKTRVTVLETQMLGVAHNMEKLETKVEGQYVNLHARISDMRDDLRNEIDNKHTLMMEKLDQHMTTEEQHHKSVQDKISTIEKWRWMIMGGAIVIGYVLAHLKLEKFF